MSRVCNGWVSDLLVSMFQVSQEKATGRRKAVEIVLVKTARERREEEQLQKVMWIAGCCGTSARVLGYPTGRTFQQWLPSDQRISVCHLPCCTDQAAGISWHISH